jgi:hypothetical protein
MMDILQDRANGSKVNATQRDRQTARDISNAQDWFASRGQRILNKRTISLTERQVVQFCFVVLAQQGAVWDCLDIEQRMCKTFGDLTLIVTCCPRSTNTNLETAMIAVPPRDSRNPVQDSNSVARVNSVTVISSIALSIEQPMQSFVHHFSSEHPLFSQLTAAAAADLQHCLEQWTNTVVQTTNLCPCVVRRVALRFVYSIA